MINNSDDLVNFISEVSGDKQLRIEEDLGDGFVRLRIAEAERRQAKHDIQTVEDAVIELLRNARDAYAKNIYLATALNGSYRKIIVLDDGDGIPDDLQDLIFEPRVTSKLETLTMDSWGIHGRGMALYSIAQNACEAKVNATKRPGGSVIETIFNTNEVRERADQSSWPLIKKDNQNKVSIESGTHNINRIGVEFVLETKKPCKLYIGSMAQIAATLFKNARDKIQMSSLLFVDDLNTISPCDRLAYAASAQELSQIAASLGLVISDRTALRILNGSLEPLSDVQSKIEQEVRNSQQKATVDLLKDQRGLKLSVEDRDDFADQMVKAFKSLADKYFVSLTDKPNIRVGHDKITVIFPIKKD